MVRWAYNQKKTGRGGKICSQTRNRWGHDRVDEERLSGDRKEISLL